QYSILYTRCVFCFVQAEDGIRAFLVTGVQTCALPICRISTNSPNSFLKWLQPRMIWRTREWALYWVSTPTRRIPELMQLDRGKSTIRYLPPKYTAGLARQLVSS